MDSDGGFGNQQLMNEYYALRAQMASRICASMTASIVAAKSSFWGIFMTKKSFVDLVSMTPGMSVNIADEILEAMDKSGGVVK